MPSNGARVGAERLAIALLIACLGALLLPATPGQAWLLAFAAAAATAKAVVRREERLLAGRAGPSPGSIFCCRIPDLFPRGSRLILSTASRAPPLPG